MRWNISVCSASACRRAPREREAEAGVPHDGVLELVAAVSSRAPKACAKPTPRRTSNASSAAVRSGSTSSTTQPIASSAARLSCSTAVTSASTGRSPSAAPRDPRPARVDVGPSTKLSGGSSQRERRPRVRAGHRPQQQRGILHAARQRAEHAHRVPRVGRRHLRHATGRRPQPDELQKDAGLRMLAPRSDPWRSHAVQIGRRCHRRRRGGGFGVSETSSEFSDLELRKEGEEGAMEGRFPAPARRRGANWRKS